ncbi:hypothetical protein N0V88_006781 [Collariella sp. IMI 366227]|nr:hypothetical protein N0V88_006781 [Collariella sp. IMI 366227]
MTARNVYLAYKRDTSQLLYWIIWTSNGIIKSGQTETAVADYEIEAPAAVNTTGELTVANLVALSRLIAKHINPIPATILALFSSVVSENPDPAIEKSNSTHKHFIDALIKAFHALGGKDWNPNAESKDSPDGDAAHVKEELDRLVLQNQFGGLGLRQIGAEDEEDSDNEDEGEEPTRQAAASSSQRRRQPRASKGKKGKRGKKGKKQPKPAPVNQPTLEDVPLESYRIIQDTDGIITDYLVAVYALVKEWIDLRTYVQGLWRDCAYGGLNSAVAAAVSNLAIAMVQRTASAMFVDFPGGHDTYETIMNTITRGNPEQAQGMFSIALLNVAPCGQHAHKVRETAVDVKEQFMIYAYRDLIDFLEDFQKTRSGKPTKRLLAELRDWDPRFNLQRATNEKRVRWRRVYTINWLYDLVNVFSSIVVQRNTTKGENHVLEKVDWSPSGPWDMHRRLFGLNEFAGVITSLAFQKQGTDIRKHVLPHHVFQLQCIVDSLMVSRGWSISPFKGHIVTQPAQSFRPRRDVDLFLDRKVEREGHGFLHGFKVLNQLFDKDADLHRDPGRHDYHHAFLESLQYDFCNWLGESKYMYGLNTIPPSRFSNTNANGLWEYSPFLCGAGLVEGLELSFIAGMRLWEQMPEPLSLVHLHNMLVKKGYLKKPVGLYATLSQLLGQHFFHGAKPPSTNFAEAFTAQVQALFPRGARHERLRVHNQAAAAHGLDFHQLLHPDQNRLFNAKSALVAYHHAKYNLAAMPDADIHVTSPFFMVRLSQTNKTVDPVTGETRFEETNLVKRARAEGMDDKTFECASLSTEVFQPASWPSSFQPPQNLLAQALPQAGKAGWMDAAGGYTLNATSWRKQGELDARDLLEIAKLDLRMDVSGDLRPLSSLNYVWVTAVMMMLFMMIEDELKELRNPLYVDAYEQSPAWAKNKRGRLALLALEGQDEECLHVMAARFDAARLGFMSHIYWKDLDHLADTKGKATHAANMQEDVLGPDACSVM